MAERVRMAETGVLKGVRGRHGRNGCAVRRAFGCIGRSDRGAGRGDQGRTREDRPSTFGQLSPDGIVEGQARGRALVAVTAALAGSPQACMAR